MGLGLRPYDREVAMRRGYTRLVMLGLGVLTATVLTGSRSHAQYTSSAKIPNMDQRSGLLGRYAPVNTTLPHDPDRDDFYDTRYGPWDPNHPNRWGTGGIYGQRWKAEHTRSVAPYFPGKVGQSTINANSKPPKHRLISNYLFPWRPVGMYYESGSYVPVYDLDPNVVGPGPFPYPHFWNGPRGG